MWKWIIVLIATGGTVLNIRKNRWGFALWNISNTYWVIYNCSHQEYAEATIFLTGIIFSTLGFIKWSKVKK